MVDISSRYQPRTHGAQRFVAFDRDLITVFDVLLIVVLGLVLYALSARDPSKQAGVLDVLRLVAIAAALLLDAIVLSSMLARIAEYGLTPNRVVAIGLNLILIVNLAVTAWFRCGCSPSARRRRRSSGGRRGTCRCSRPGRR